MLLSSPYFSCTASTRLSKYIKDSGLSYKQNSKSYIFTCPLCNHKEKLYIRKLDGRFACWRCRYTEGFQGAPEYALAALLDIPILIVKKALYGNLIEQATAFIDIKADDFIDEDEVLEESIDNFTYIAWPNDFLELQYPAANRGVEYLKSRGITADIAKQYQIRYSPEKQALVFPILINNNLVGWQYRSILKELQVLNGTTINTYLKVWSSKDVPRDRVFMFEHRLHDSQQAILCEGPFDALKAHLCNGNICSMGKAVTQQQINRLLRSGIQRVYVALDPDAFDELTPIFDKFNDSVEVFKVNIPLINSKPDLGALTLEQAKQCILAAQPLKRNQLFPWLKPLPHL